MLWRQAVCEAVKLLAPQSMLRLDSTRLASCQNFATIDEVMEKCNISEDSGFKDWLRHGLGIGEHNDRPLQSMFFVPLIHIFMSLPSSPFICHDGTSFKAELHQRACSRC